MGSACKQKELVSGLSAPPIGTPGLQVQVSREEGDVESPASLLFVHLQHLFFSFQYVAGSVNENETFHTNPRLCPESNKKTAKVLCKHESTLQNEGRIIIWESSLQHSPFVFGNTMLNTFQTIKSHQAVQMIVFK